MRAQAPLPHRAVGLPCPGTFLRNRGTSALLPPPARMVFAKTGDAQAWEAGTPLCGRLRDVVGHQDAAQGGDALGVQLAVIDAGVQRPGQPVAGLLHAHSLVIEQPGTCACPQLMMEMSSPASDRGQKVGWM